jgi:anti-sigma factor RsiW
VNCDELEPLLTPFVDDEASPGDRERVTRHLGQCPPCAGRAAAERSARKVLQVRSAVLRTPAPPALRARCEALASRSPRRAAWRAAWRGLGLSAAAAVVLILAVVGYGAVSHSPAMFVASLTIDHLKCFAFLEGRSGPADARGLSQTLEREYGWHVTVPAGLAGERLTLVGARRCLSSDGTIAHVMYRHAGRPVSLFVLPAGARAAARTSFAGYPAEIWSRGEKTYVLVASESDAVVRPVAEYFRAAAN